MNDEAITNANFNKIIGANIRYERQLRSLTIEELAEILGLAPGFLGLIERGQRGTTIKNLVKMADFFSITLDTLITRRFSALGQDAGMPPIELKRRSAIDLIKSLNEYELDYIILCLKGLIKLKNIPGEFEY